MREIYGNLTENLDSRISDFRKGIKRGIKSGLKLLDQGTGGFMPGRLYIVGARTSVGKTTLAVNFSASATAANKQVFFCTNEMSADEIGEKYLSCVAGVVGSKITEGSITDEEGLKLLAAIQLTVDRKLFIDEKSGLFLENFTRECHRLKRLGRVDLIILDYIQQMRTSEIKSQEKNPQLTHISGSLKTLARDLNVPVIALAQLNREYEKDKSTVPSLFHIKDCGAIEQDADVGILLFREELKCSGAPGEFQYFINVAKNRFGKVGVIPIKTDLPVNRFLDGDF